MGSKDDSPSTTSLARWVRGRTPDGNPLRRTTDRLETAVLAVLVITFLAAAPFVAQACGAAAREAAHQEQLAQEASLRQVPALVIKNASSAQATVSTLSTPKAQVRWTAPDGHARTGETPVPTGTRAGATVPVWVTNSGQLASPPLLDSQVAGTADLAATGGVALLGFVIVNVGLATRRVLNKRRMAAWEAEWRAVGPRWTTPA